MMDIKKVIIIITSIIFLCLTSKGYSAFINRFKPTDIDQNASYLEFWNGLKSGWKFGVYDYGGNPKDGIVLLKGGYKYEGIEFYIDKNNGEYKLTTSTNDSILLGSTPEISFFIKNGNNYYTNLSIEGNIDTSTFRFSYGNSGEVTVVDVRSVPLPDSLSLILIICPIIGFLFVRKREDLV